jgi:mRNA interferase MazF
MNRNQSIINRGDVVWLNFDPQEGHEQAGRRPALVLSPAEYNRKSGLAIVCPITNKIKGHAFEVVVPDGVGVTGCVLADQVKTVDWDARLAEFHCRMPDIVVSDVLDLIGLLLHP